MKTSLYRITNGILKYIVKVMRRVLHRHLQEFTRDEKMKYVTILVDVKILTYLIGNYYYSETGVGFRRFVTRDGK